MAVQCVMFVQSVKQNSHDKESREIEFTVISRGDHAKEWSKYTPSGRTTLYVTNPAAIAQFEVGREYLITFEPYEKPES